MFFIKEKSFFKYIYNLYKLTLFLLLIISCNFFIGKAFILRDKILIGNVFSETIEFSKILIINNTFVYIY